uniref:Proteophosphoglycan ppg4, related n=1 Tax=Neospora caninum (strain Liverpool) TaxID=572307 RepID=A0A0F7U7M5_NEOCL|nr:TPA: hypothetical protein BN1204_005197 [Neospora caninum Liverpool]
MEVATVALLALSGAVGAAALEATSGLQAGSQSLGDDSEEEDSLVPNARDRITSPSRLEAMGEPRTSLVPDAREDTIRESVSLMERNHETYQENERREFFDIPQSQPCAFPWHLTGATSLSSDLMTGRHRGPDARLTVSHVGMFAESKGNVPDLSLGDGQIHDVYAPLFGRRLRSYTTSSRPLDFAASGIHRPEFLPASLVQAGEPITADASERRLGLAFGVTGERGSASNVAWSASSSGKSDKQAARFCRSEQRYADCSTQEESTVKRGAFWLFRAFTRLSGPLRRGQTPRTTAADESTTPRDCDQQRQQRRGITQDVSASTMIPFSSSCGECSARQEGRYRRSRVDCPCYNAGMEARAGAETEQVTSGRPNISRETTEPSACLDEASSRSTTTTAASDREGRSSSGVTGAGAPSRFSRDVGTAGPRCLFDSSSGFSRSASAPSADGPVTSAGRKRRMLSPSTCSVSSHISRGVDAWMNSPHPKRRRRNAESQTPDLGGSVSLSSGARENHSHIGRPSKQLESMSRSSSFPKAESKYTSRVRVDHGTMPRRLLDILQDADGQTSDRECGGKGRREGRQKEAHKLATPTPTTGSGFMLDFTSQVGKRTSLETNPRPGNAQFPDASSILERKDNVGVQLDDGENSVTMPPISSTWTTCPDQERAQEEERGQRREAEEQGETESGEYEMHPEATDADRSGPLPCSTRQSSEGPSDARASRETLKKRACLLGRRVLPPWPAILEAKHVAVEKPQGAPRESEQGSRGQRNETVPGQPKTPEHADDDAPLPNLSTGRSGRTSPVRHRAAKDTHAPETRKSQSGTFVHGDFSARSDHPSGEAGFSHREGKTPCAAANKNGERKAEQVEQKKLAPGASLGGSAEGSPEVCEARETSTK